MSSLLRYAPMLITLILCLLTVAGGTWISWIWFTVFGLLILPFLTTATWFFIPHDKPNQATISDMGSFLGRRWAQANGYRYLIAEGNKIRVQPPGEDRLHVNADGWRLQLQLPGTKRSSLTSMKAGSVTGLLLVVTVLCKTLMSYTGTVSLGACALLLFGAAAATTTLTFLHMLAGALLYIYLRTRQALTITRRGQVLHYGHQVFHLANAGTQTTLKQGLWGSQLVLQNSKETIKIKGQYGDLAWLEETIDGVAETEAEQVPQAINQLIAGTKTKTTQ